MRVAGLHSTQPGRTQSKTVPQKIVFWLDGCLTWTGTTLVCWWIFFPVATKLAIIFFRLYRQQVVCRNGVRGHTFDSRVCTKDVWGMITGRDWSVSRNMFWTVTLFSLLKFFFALNREGSLEVPTLPVSPYSTCCVRCFVLSWWWLSELWPLQHVMNEWNVTSSVTSCLSLSAQNTHETVIFHERNITAFILTT